MQTTLSKYVKAMRKQHRLTQVEPVREIGCGTAVRARTGARKPTLRLDKVNQILNLFGAEIGVVPMTKTDDR